MKNLFIRGAILLVGAGLALGQTVSRPTQNSAPSGTSSRALLDQYCVSCHNQKVKTAGLTLDTMNPDQVSQNTEAWERVVRKLRAGMMPPQGMPRPNPSAYEALTVAL